MGVGKILFGEADLDRFSVLINLFSSSVSFSSNVCTYPLRGPLFLLSAYSHAIPIC